MPLCECVMRLFQDDWGSSDSSSKSKGHSSDDKAQNLETLPPGRKHHYTRCTCTLHSHVQYITHNSTQPLAEDDRVLPIVKKNAYMQ